MAASDHLGQQFGPRYRVHAVKIKHSDDDWRAARSPEGIYLERHQNVAEVNTREDAEHAAAHWEKSGAVTHIEDTWAPYEDENGRTQ